MATFGEIVEPSSRAVWETYDSDDESEEKLSWYKQVEPLENIDLFLLVEGNSAVEFVERCLITEEAINYVDEGKMHLYVLPNKSTVICTSLNSDDNKMSDLLYLIEPYFGPSNIVIAIQSLPLTQYKSHMGSDGTCIRTLRTEYGDKTTNIKLLEQPNILSGVAAGVVCRRDFMGKAASIYACYMDCTILGLDSTNVKPLIDLFAKLDIPCSKQFAPKVKIPSNLYI